MNAGVKGELRAELLDSEGRVLPGFSADDCVPIRSDGLRQMIRWNRVFQLDSLFIVLKKRSDRCAIGLHKLQHGTNAGEIESLRPRNSVGEV